MAQTPTPESLIVGPAEVTVEESTTFVGTDCLWGEYNASDLKINYMPDLARPLERMILVHEVGHALCEILGITLTQAQEEKVCKVLLPHFLMVERDNPEFAKYLLEDD